MPIAAQIVGLAGFLYELVFDQLDRPAVVAACVTLALGGRFADVLRNVL